MGFHAIHETQPRFRPLKRVSPKTHTPDRHLHISGLRYYSPELGRWLSRDPIGENGGVNIYGFVWNMPVSFIDLVGLSGIPILNTPCQIHVRLTHAWSSDMLGMIEAFRSADTDCAYFFPFTCYVASFYDDLGDLRIPGMPSSAYWTGRVIASITTRGMGDLYVTEAYRRLEPYLKSAAKGMCGCPCFCETVNVSFSWDERSDLRERAREFPSIPAETYIFDETGTATRINVSANVLDTTWLYDCARETWTYSVVDEPTFDTPRIF